MSTHSCYNGLIYYHLSKWPFISVKNSLFLDQTSFFKNSATVYLYSWVYIQSWNNISWKNLKPIKGIKTHSVMNRCFWQNLTIFFFFYHLFVLKIIILQYKICLHLTNVLHKNDVSNLFILSNVITILYKEDLKKNK